MISGEPADPFDAFREDGREPPPLTLRGACDIDSYDPPSPFDPALDDTSDAYIERHAFWAMPHLDPQSWRYYLPWLMAYARRRPDDPAMAAEALVRSLRPPDGYPPRLGSLTQAQELTVREFLEAIAFGDGVDTLRDEAQQALEEWWLPRPRARPTADDIAARRATPVTYHDVHDGGCRLAVPDTLAASGVRDLPAESRRVQTWGGYVCGDVPMTVALNLLSAAAITFDDVITRYAAFFQVPAVGVDIVVSGARRARRIEGATRVSSRAGSERLVMIVADAREIVTLTIRAAERPDVRSVIDRVAASFGLVAAS